MGKIKYTLVSFASDGCRNAWHCQVLLSAAMRLGSNVNPRNARAVARPSVSFGEPAIFPGHEPWVRMPPLGRRRTVRYINAAVYPEQAVPAVPIAGMKSGQACADGG